MEKPLRHSENGSEKLILKGEITIQDAAELKEELLQTFREGTHILIDLNEVDDLDVSSVQLLYAAKEYAQKNSQDFSIQNIRSFEEQLEKSGFKAWFEPFFSDQN